jgi:hypothetical protein
VAFAEASPPGLATERSLRRDERRWTRWTVAIVVAFSAPSLVLLWLEPLMAPFALIWSAHGYAICRMQAGRGVRSVVAIGGPRSAAATGSRANPGAEGVALGLLGDLLDHGRRELLQRTGLALEPGSLGTWLVGEQGALLVRPGGHRVDSWCVRVGEQDDLPAGDRVANLLLALREDERGFATVANLGFSGAYRRTRARMAEAQRPALAVARRLVRGPAGV